MLALIYTTKYRRKCRPSENLLYLFIFNCYFVMAEPIKLSGRSFISSSQSRLGSVDSAALLQPTGPRP